ncbi:hypothetical protein MRX96_015162 [Rhipicephalus microplus]
MSQFTLEAAVKSVPEAFRGLNAAMLDATPDHMSLENASTASTAYIRGTPQNNALRRFMSQQEIACKLNQPQQTINHNIRAFYWQYRLNDAPHQRWPKKRTEDEDALMITAVVKDPFTTTKKIKKLGLPLSLSASRRRFSAGGLKSHVAARKPLLGSEHRRKCLDFVLQHEHWSAEDWKRIIFTDESTFTSCGNMRLRVWRVRGSR